MKMSSRRSACENIVTRVFLKDTNLTSLKWSTSTIFQYQLESRLYFGTVFLIKFVIYVTLFRKPFV